MNRIFDLYEGYEFLLEPDFDINNMTPAQKQKLQNLCKHQSYDYLFLTTILSALITSCTKTLDDIDVVVAILGSIINDLLLLRTVRVTCENNMVNSFKGLSPASTLAPGFLFSLDSDIDELSRSSLPATPKKKIKKIKRIKKVKKVKK